jgi:hypothetical protein
MLLRILILGLAVIVSVVGGWAILVGSARAQPAFKKYFDEKYFPMKGDTAMKTAYETSSCNFCHIGGTSEKERKNRNAFGQALDKLLSKEDADNLTFKKKMDEPDVYKKAEDKVRKAIQAVEKQPSDPKNPKAPTFGQLLKEGKLPKSPATTPSP